MPSARGTGSSAERPFRLCFALGFSLGLLWPCATALGQGGGIVVSVVVRDANTGQAVPDAEITLKDPTLGARTDLLGRALLRGVPDTSRFLTVRRLGYAPQMTPLHASGSDTVCVEVQLYPVALQLPRTTVIDSGAFSPLPEFESRRGKRGGWFITEKEIRAAFGSRLAELLMTKIPGVRVGKAPGFPRAVAYSTRGPRSIQGDLCIVDVYLDGVRVSNADVDIVPLSLLAAIEYYAPGFVPVKYRALGAAPKTEGGSAACGVLLLWTIR